MGWAAHEAAQEENNGKNNSITMQVHSVIGFVKWVRQRRPIWLVFAKNDPAIGRSALRFALRKSFAQVAGRTPSSRRPNKLLGCEAKLGGGGPALGHDAEIRLEHAHQLLMISRQKCAAESAPRQPGIGDHEFVPWNIGVVS